jgi:hypothetical protein
MMPLCKTIFLLLPGLGAATAAEPVPQQPLNEQHHPILSLRLQGDFVFASTTEGLYRARLDKKQWKRLPGDTVPEPGGIFVADPPDHKSLLYFVTPASTYTTAWRVDKDVTKNIRRPGLYRSQDQGETWELVSNAYNFGEMVHLPNGRLFALAGPWNDTSKPQVVLFSESGGKEWKDITNNIGKDYPCLSIIRDPDHLQRVCLLSAFTMRTGGMILQAADDKFLWKEVYSSLRAEREWPPLEKKTEEEFFYHWYYVGYRLNWAAGAVRRLPEELPEKTFGTNTTGFSTSAGMYARLNNYFALPFGSDTKLSAFDIVPEMPAYEFRSKEPLTVNVNLTYRAEPGPLTLLPKLVDARDAKCFWSLKVSGLGGLKQDLRPKNPGNPFVERKQGQKLADILKTHEAWQFSLTPEKPNRRTIDLRDLGMPEEPGSYRVQLRYDCSWSDDEGIGRTLGTVTGQVFTVKILAADK